MDNMLGGGGGGVAAGQFPLEQWFYEMPVCTRWWTTATVATSILVQCHIITPFQLFYSFRAVFIKSQVTSLRSLPFHNLPPTPTHRSKHSTNITSFIVECTVLASNNHIPLLRPPLPRPPLPRLLPPALLPPPRRIFRPLPGALLMAPPLRHHRPPHALTLALHAVSGERAEQQLGVHLEPKESGDSPELFGLAGVHGAVSSVGAYGVLAGLARDGTEG